MKWSPSLLMLPVALGAGFLIGRQSDKDPAKAPIVEQKNTRESRSTGRGSRSDPFGGPTFSLSSMEEIRNLFKKQGQSVAAARITLGVNTLKADELPAMMEMVRQDARDSPNDYAGRYVLMNALFERWAEVDPSAALDFAKNCKQRSFKLQAVSSCFVAIAKADSGLATKELDSLPKGDLRSQAMIGVVAALSDEDPKAACDFLEKEEIPGPYGSYYAAQIFSAWAKTDPEAAAARMATLPKDRVGEESAAGLAAVWALKDPEAALKWAKTLKGDWKSNASIQVYKALSRENPAAAWERLKDEPGHLRGKLIGGVLETVADEDPGQAAKMLKGLENKSEQRIAASQLISQFSWTDNRLGFEIMDQLDDPAIRRDQLSSLLTYATLGSPDIFQEQIEKMTEREKIDTAGPIVQGLMGTDPAAAEKYYMSLPESQRSTTTLGYLMQQYSNKDPQKAFDFATSLTNPQEQTVAVNGVFTNWSREDPEAAAEGWKKLPTGQSRLEALDSIAASWAGSDPVAAQAWAETLGGTDRARALAAVLPQMARDNPSLAATQLATLIASPPEGMEKNLASSASSLASQWASKDPQAAAKWASSLPEGQSRDEGLKGISQAWSQYDAIAAAEWLSGLAAGSSRDAAIQPLVDQVRSTDPKTAFSWASSINDESKRLEQLRQTLGTWRTSDPRAARAAFEAADLSGKERADLAKELE